MCGNNCNVCNLFNGNWWWIILLILLICCCGSNGNNWNGCDNNNCGCC